MVVCGANLNANRSLASQIERGANGTPKCCPPHLNEGRMRFLNFSLTRDRRKAITFDETSNRRASS